MHASRHQAQAMHLSSCPGAQYDWTACQLAGAQARTSVLVQGGYHPASRAQPCTVCTNGTAFMFHPGIARPWQLDCREIAPQVSPIDLKLSHPDVIPMQDRMAAPMRLASWICPGFPHRRHRTSLPVPSPFGGRSFPPLGLPLGGRSYPTGFPL